ncbi:MAG: DNA adenine methylase [bacterium]|nr:DNA adenine methylase [bacterium]
MSRPPQIFHPPISAGFDEVLGAIANEQRPQARSVPAKPFVKWVGGKRSILPLLMERLPKEYTAYHEPFAGGGALYFALQPQRATLSDVNLHLVLTYIAIRDDVERLITLLREHTQKHGKTYYLKARKRLSTEEDGTVIASLFIYINKTCFNGLYRVNKDGAFNVPMGKYTNPPILDEDTLRADHAVLQGTKIVCQSFSSIRPKQQAFYYLDPPYHATYDGYNGSGFNDDKHRELAAMCRKIDEKGGYFMLSNSDTPFVRDLYRAYTIERVEASRSVSCKAHQRGKEHELIIRNY